ncbi:MAG: hypothetical protein HZB55_10965 [Deltaproteobacteria bacterium]|nr:hypothetical protein [Deltaproteobacteria bacterium]
MKSWAARLSLFLLCFATTLANPALAWHDETHLAVAKAAGYAKWYNAVGPDIAKIKAGAIEQNNHYVNNPGNAPAVTAADVMKQVSRYNTVEPTGHLYGAIIAAVRNYVAEKAKGKYGEYHLAYAAHYVADLSMPLHNTEYNAFNQKNHAAIDGLVESEVLENLARIRIYPITIRSEEDLAREIARVANLSCSLGRRLEAEDRLPTKDEAYGQLSHSASLLRAILEYTKAPMLAQNEGTNGRAGQATTPVRLVPMGQREVGPGS